MSDEKKGCDCFHPVDESCRNELSATENSAHQHGILSPTYSRSRIQQLSATSRALGVEHGFALIVAGDESQPRLQLQFSPDGGDTFGKPIILSEPSARVEEKAKTVRSWPRMSERISTPHGSELCGWCDPIDGQGD